MDQPATHNARPKPQPSRPIPGRVARFLTIVGVLLGYGKRLDAILAEQATHARFPTLAIGFGTHDIRRIASHIQRGLLRAAMLRRYLLARAAQNRDIEPTPPPRPRRIGRYRRIGPAGPPVPTAPPWETSSAYRSRRSRPFRHADIEGIGGPGPPSFDRTYGRRYLSGSRPQPLGLRRWALERHS